MTSLPVKVVEALFLSIIFLGAFIGNVLLFVLVAKTPGLQTKGNVFILNLAAADLMVTVINMPITIVAVISEEWILGEMVCLVSGFITLLTFVASCMALSMISINRYHAIVHWTTYRSKYTRKKCALYVIIVWAITTGLSIPPFFGWAKFDYDEGQSYCFAEWSESKSYTVFMIAACLCGPLTIMTYCYVGIIKFHKKSKKTIRASSHNWSKPGESSTSFSATTGDDPRAPTTATAKSRGKLTRTIMTLIIVFACCWSPFAIIMIVQVFFKVHVPRSIDFGSLVLGYMNSCFNVFVYNATNRNIRKAFKKILCCERTRHTPFRTRNEKY